MSMNKLTFIDKTLNVNQERFTNMSGIVRLLANVLTSAPTVTTTNVTRTGSNPFAAGSGNPFVLSQDSNPFADYGQNKPVPGGYFAGYYNNQPNIVGRRLFIEV